MTFKQENISDSAIHQIMSKDWNFGIDRRMTYQMMYLVYFGYRTQLNRFFGLDFRDYIFRIKDGNNAQYSWGSNQKTNLDLIKKRLETCDNKFIDLILKTINSGNKKGNRYVSRMPTSYSGCDNKSLFDKYEEFKEYQEMISLPIWLTFVPFENILTQIITDKLYQHGFSSEEAIKFFDIISKPVSVIPLDNYLCQINKAALLSVKKKTRIINEITEDFSCLGMFDFNYELTPRITHEERISSVTPEIAKDFLRSIKNKYRGRKRSTNNAIKKFKNDKHFFSLLKFYTLYADFKEWKNFYREQASLKARYLFAEISSRLNISLDEVGFITYDEIKSALLDNVTQDRSLLQKRISNSALIFIEDTLSIITDDKMLKIVDEKLANKIQDKITGTVAYPGIVRGKVRIVISNNDFDKISEGDILVTSTTRPDYIRVMEKSAAFITNEGGMLSHAAILAREMKKPCIIGTKIATRVLKDGDTVEVDADNGIVRILK